MAKVVMAAWSDLGHPTAHGSPSDSTPDGLIGRGLVAIADWIGHGANTVERGGSIPRTTQVAP
jgi:hypothetical protein